jgi:hypothetical protein
LLPNEFFIIPSKPFFLPFNPSLKPQLRGFGRCPWLKARSRAILTVLSMLVRFLRRRPMESGLLMLLQ